CRAGKLTDTRTRRRTERERQRTARRHRSIDRLDNHSIRCVHHSGFTATLRNFTTPSPHCSVKWPSSKKPLFTSAVLVPLSVSVRCRLSAVISIVFHLPATLSAGLASAK